jgi:hypothetical protein
MVFSSCKRHYDSLCSIFDSTMNNTNCKLENYNNSSHGLKEVMEIKVYLDL